MQRRSRNDNRFAYQLIQPLRTQSCQLVDEFDLSGKQFRLRGLDIEPLGAVHILKPCWRPVFGGHSLELLLVTFAYLSSLPELAVFDPTPRGCGIDGF